MNSNLYTCDYCHKEYIPTRRGVQRFCKASCRTRSHQIKNQSRLSSPAKEKKKKKKKTIGKVKKMSLAGIGNAVVGNVTSDLVQKFLTKEENKPATKKDIEKLIQLLQSRFYRVNNLPLNIHDQQPYFDLATMNIVYR